MYYCWYCPDVLDIHSIFGQYLITPSVGLCVRPRTTQICSKFRFQFVNLVETHMVVWIGNADREWVICNETGNSIHAKWGILNWTHSIRCIFWGLYQETEYRHVFASTAENREYANGLPIKPRISANNTEWFSLFRPTKPPTKHTRTYLSVIPLSDTTSL